MQRKGTRRNIMILNPCTPPHHEHNSYLCQYAHPSITCVPDPDPSWDTVAASLRVTAFAVRINLTMTRELW